MLASPVEHCATIEESFYACPTVKSCHECAGTSMVGPSMSSNPIRRNFYGLSFEADFHSYAFLQLTLNHRTLAETVQLGKIDVSIPKSLQYC